MEKMNPEVDWFFEKKTKWQDEYSALRSIILKTELSEELKWGCPCYTLNGNNVVLIHGFKEYCAILFHKGVLLKDNSNLLIQQTENVQSARQLRFKSLKEIKNLESKIITYIKEAIQIEKKGIKVNFKKTTGYKMPIEFKNVLDEMPDVKMAFESLTPGRQRGYLLYFSS